MKERVGRALALLHSHRAKADAYDIRSDGDPADMITEHVKRSGADLVVMGAYGHGGLCDAIFGSCTRRLLAECSAALFLQH